MAADDAVELSLSWDGARWRAAGPDIDVAHADLSALDTLIVEALTRTRRATKAHVRFDFSRMPTWLRQYQAHYFNYVLHVDGGERA